MGSTTISYQGAYLRGGRPHTDPRRRALQMLREEALADIEAGVASSEGWFELHGIDRLCPPPTNGGGEWDWWRYQLRSVEQRRILNRWTSSTGCSPDEISHALHLEIGAAMREWVHHTRVVDAYRSMLVNKSGRGWVPTPGPLGGLDLDDLFPSQFRLMTLFAPLCVSLDYLSDALIDEAYFDQRRQEENPWPDCSSPTTDEPF